MIKINTLILLFSLVLLECKAQNQPLLPKEKLEEFRTLLIQNVQFQTGSLSTYKNISFGINECDIQITTIDYENSKDENLKITLPTSGAILKDNGELSYQYKAIEETIENEITKQISINLYDNSKYIGLLLKLENKEQFKITQEKLKELSAYCKSLQLEKKE